MKMDMFIGTVLLGASLFTNCFCKIEENVKNFEDAKHFCEFQNLSLLSYGEKLVEEVLRTNFTGKLWIGKPWYKEIDCYKTEPNITIPGGSLYNCSTHCNGFDHIGLQEHSCACFNNFEENPERKCKRNDKLQTQTESLKFGTDDTSHWVMYKKERWQFYKINVVHVSEQRIFQFAYSETGKEKFICTNNYENTTALKKATVKKPQTTTTEYEDYEKKNDPVSDNSYIIPTVVVSGIAVLPVLCVVIVVIIKKRNHTGITHEEMEVMEHNYSSVQKVGRPIIENPSYDVDVSMNKPQVDLKENEGNADTNVYDTAGASNNTQSNSSEIYDHTNSTEGVYDVTDHVKQKENDADNTYDHV